MHRMDVITDRDRATGETRYRLTCSCHRYFPTRCRAYQLRIQAQQHLDENRPFPAIPAGIARKINAL